MNKKTAIIILAAAAITGGVAIAGYNIQKNSRNLSNAGQNQTEIKVTATPQAAQSPEASITPQAAQSPEAAAAPQATQSPEPTGSPEPTAQSSSGKLTSDKALEIIKNIVIKNSSNAKVAFDHIQKRDGKDYYVIRLYESMPDHAATLGWFYVQVDTGKAFEWDLTDDKLIPLN